MKTLRLITIFFKKKYCLTALLTVLYVNISIDKAALFQMDRDDACCGSGSRQSSAHFLVLTTSYFLFSLVGILSAPICIQIPTSHATHGVLVALIRVLSCVAFYLLASVH